MKKGNVENPLKTMGLIVNQADQNLIKEIDTMILENKPIQLQKAQEYISIIAKSLGMEEDEITKMKEESPEEFKKIWRKYQLKYHPDKFERNFSDEAAKKLSEKELKEFKQEKEEKFKLITKFKDFMLNATIDPTVPLEKEQAELFKNFLLKQLIIKCEQLVDSAIAQEKDKFNNLDSILLRFNNKVIFGNFRQEFLPDILKDKIKDFNIEQLKTLKEFIKNNARENSTVYKIFHEQIDFKIKELEQTAQQNAENEAAQGQEQKSPRKQEIPETEEESLKALLKNLVDFAIAQEKDKFNNLDSILVRTRNSYKISFPKVDDFREKFLPDILKEKIQDFNIEQLKTLKEFIKNNARENSTVSDIFNTAIESKRKELELTAQQNAENEAAQGQEQKSPRKQEIPETEEESLKALLKNLVDFAIAQEKDKFNNLDSILVRTRNSYKISFPKVDDFRKEFLPDILKEKIKDFDNKKLDELKTFIKSNARKNSTVYKIFHKEIDSRNKEIKQMEEQQSSRNQKISETEEAILKEYLNNLVDQAIEGKESTFKGIYNILLRSHNSHKSLFPEGGDFRRQFLPAILKEKIKDFNIEQLNELKTFITDNVREEEDSTVYKIFHEQIDFKIKELEQTAQQSSRNQEIPENDEPILKGLLNNLVDSAIDQEKDEFKKLDFILVSTYNQYKSKFSEFGDFRKEFLPDILKDKIKDFNIEQLKTLKEFIKNNARENSTVYKIFHEQIDFKIKELEQTAQQNAENEAAQGQEQKSPRKQEILPDEEQSFKQLLNILVDRAIEKKLDEFINLEGILVISYNNQKIKVVDFRKEFLPDILKDKIKDFNLERLDELKKFIDSTGLRKGTVYTIFYEQIDLRRKEIEQTEEQNAANKKAQAQEQKINDDRSKTSVPIQSESNPEQFSRDSLKKKEVFISTTSVELKEKSSSDTISGKFITSDGNSIHYSELKGRRDTQEDSFLLAEGNFSIESEVQAEKFLRDSFNKIDKYVQDQNNRESFRDGSTATATIITKEGMLYAAHLGDSPLYIYRMDQNGQMLDQITLIKDGAHHPINDQEEVEKQGGRILFNGRLNGQLAVTRAFGDYTIGNVSKNPDFYSHNLRQYLDKGERVFISSACDGLHELNLFTTGDMKDIIKNNSTLEDKNIALLSSEEAFRNGSKDNITSLFMEVKKEQDIDIAMLVADGHGGDKVSKMVTSQFNEILLERHQVREYTQESLVGKANEYLGNNEDLRNQEIEQTEEQNAANKKAQAQEQKSDDIKFSAFQTALTDNYKLFIQELKNNDFKKVKEITQKIISLDNQNPSPDLSNESLLSFIKDVKDKAYNEIKEYIKDEKDFSKLKQLENFLEQNKNSMKGFFDNRKSIDKFLTDIRDKTKIEIKSQFSISFPPILTFEQQIKKAMKTVELMEKVELTESESDYNKSNKQPIVSSENLSVSAGVSSDNEKKNIDKLIDYILYPQNQDKVNLDLDLNFIQNITVDYINKSDFPEKIQGKIKSMEARELNKLKGDIENKIDAIFSKINNQDNKAGIDAIFHDDNNQAGNFLKNMFKGQIEEKLKQEKKELKENRGLLDRAVDFCKAIYNRVIVKRIILSKEFKEYQNEKTKPFFNSGISNDNLEPLEQKSKTNDFKEKYHRAKSEYSHVKKYKEKTMEEKTNNNGIS